MRTTALLALAALALTPSAAAEDFNVTPARELAGPIGILAPFIGDWEIRDTWSSGEALHARNEYRVGLAGRFVEIRTLVRDGEGPAYERYRTVFAWDPATETVVSHGFTFDGSAKSVPVKIEQADGKLTLTSSWSSGEGAAAAEIKQEVSLPDAGTAYTWKVWMRPQDGEWAQLIDGEWKRMPASPAPAPAAAGG